MALFKEEFVGIVQESFSYYDLNKRYGESFYHAFALGLLYNSSDAYKIKSNRESGKGRYDLVMIPKKNNYAYIIEFKTSYDKIDTQLCTSINGKPIVSMSNMFSNSQATEIDLSSFDTSNVTDMSNMFSVSSSMSSNISIIGRTEEDSQRYCATGYPEGSGLATVKVNDNVVCSFYRRPVYIG